jgi:hypothetical protein
MSITSLLVSFSNFCLTKMYNYSLFVLGTESNTVNLFALFFSKLCLKQEGKNLQSLRLYLLELTINFFKTIRI